MSESDQAKFNIDRALKPARDKRLRRMPRLLRLAVQLVWRAGRKEFATAAGLQVVAGASVAGQLLLAKAVLDAVLATGQGGAFTAAVPPLVGLAVVATIVSFANLARAEQQRLLSELVGCYATNQVIDVATQADLIAYEDPDYHNRLQRARINAATRPLQMATGLLGIVSGGFAIAGIAIALLVLQPVLLALVFLAFLPGWFATMKASKYIYDFSVGQTERDRRRMYLFQVLTGKAEAKEVRTFELAEFMRDQHNRLYGERIDGLRDVVRARLRWGLAGGLASSVLLAGTLGLLVWFAAAGRIDLSSAAAAAGAVVLLGQRLRGLSASTNRLYEASLFLEDFTTFVDLSAQLAAPRTGVPAPDGFRKLRTEDLVFTYPSRSVPSLRGVSMEVNAGEVVALVGENGSGKTTLAKLLANLYDPGAGRVVWDGVDVREYDPLTLRRSTAVIFQDFVQYLLTVRENIAIGRHERLDDLDSIVAAAHQAGAHGYIEQLDLGYDTRLGPEFLGGSDLSIGQWQRVALARAFVRDAPFIILDEPTAALDPRAEYELFERVRSLFVGRSVLLISHRFSSVRSADRIYVLSEGKIAEHGSHDELMARGGLYADLFTMQASAYLEQRA